MLRTEREVQVEALEIKRDEVNERCGFDRIKPVHARFLPKANRARQVLRRDHAHGY